MVCTGLVAHAHTRTHTHTQRERERERNVLFNDALNTFYLRLYGVRHMVKDHSDSEKGNPLPPHIHHPTYRITHTTAFVTPVVEHWLEREIAHWGERERTTMNQYLGVRKGTCSEFVCTELRRFPLKGNVTFSNTGSKLRKLIIWRSIHI